MDPQKPEMLDRSSIDTGVEGLDGDLTLLFELEKKGELERIRSEVSSGNLTREQFSNLVPDGLLRIAVVLGAPQNYRLILRQVLPEARQAVEEAKRIVDDRLTQVVSHGFAEERIDQLAEESAEKGPSPLLRSLKVITTLQHQLTWHGSPPALRPAVRIGFLGRNRELLLDTSLNWDDLFFVIDGLVEIAARAMGEGRILHEKGQLDFDEDEAKKLSSRVANIKASLSKIGEAAPTYGIDV